MRKVVTLMLCILLITQTIVSSNTELSYGDSLLHLRMSGVYPSKDFWNMYSGRNACQFSTDRAYRGNTSLKVDVNKIKELYSTKPHLNFATQDAEIDLYNANNDALYFEWYVSGIDNDIYNKRLSFSATFTYADGTTKTVRDGIKYEASDKNGWLKIWMVVPKSTYGDAIKCQMGIFYNTQTAGMEQVDYFYLDEMAIRLVPDKLFINNIYGTDMVDLNNVRVYGMDTSSNKKLINAKDYLKWSVVSGEGQIENGVLKRKGDVVVKCEFFGVSTEFSIGYKGLRYSPVTINNENIVSVTAYNDTVESLISDVVIALYDGMRLYSVQTIKTTIPADGNVSITSQPIKVSANIEQPVIKVYGWDNTGNMSLLK